MFLSLPFATAMKWNVLVVASFAASSLLPLPAQERPEAGTAEKRVDAIGLAPPIEGAALERRAAEAYARGLAYILPLQNEDGSWGTWVPVTPALKNFGFGTASRGSNDGVRTACTAIIATALLRHPHPSEAIGGALDRAIGELLKEKKFAYDHGEAFNTWGYGYKLAFLCELFEHPRGAELSEEIRAAASTCIKGLLRYQQADGGWNYYASTMRDGESMSFNTGNFTAALAHASQLGFPVPEGMVDDALRLLRRMQTLKGGIVYDARFIAPSAGSAGTTIELSAASRTAAVIEAFARAGKLRPDDLERAFRVFDEGENWLEDGRKHIQPHAGVHQIAGYFFFYGYYYHASLLKRAGEKVPRKRWDRDAWTMIRTQEDYGGWWDTPAAEYGDKWATGFALLVLQAYLEHAGAFKQIEDVEPDPEPANDTEGTLK